MNLEQQHDQELIFLFRKIRNWRQLDGIPRVDLILYLKGGEGDGVDAPEPTRWIHHWPLSTGFS